MLTLLLEVGVGISRLNQIISMIGNFISKIIEKARVNNQVILVYEKLQRIA
jgi:hypothetical protein